MTKQSKALVKFDFDVAVITALDAKYKDMQITDGKSYALVMAGIAEYRELRLSIDDMHKQLKKDIIEAGRSLDGDKNRLKGLLEPGETRLKEIRQVEDDRKDAIREDKARLERERTDAIQVKINGIRGLRIVQHNVASHTIEESLILLTGMKISKEVYMEFTDQAIQEKKESISGLEEALAERLQFEKDEAERKIEAERLEIQRKDQEAAQAKIDEANQVAAKRQAENDARMAAAQAKIDKENRKIDDEKAKIEAAKKAEEERKEKEEFERQATIKAEQQAEIGRIKAERDRIEREEAEKVEKQRKAAMAPDREKLIEWIQGFNETANPMPLVKSNKAIEILRIAKEQIEMILQDTMAKIQKL